MRRELALVLGGARSGKSAYAEGLVTARPAPWIYVATGQAFDAEMVARIGEHRARRGAGWRTVEAPLDVAGALAAAPEGAPVLVDCLTLWLTNVILAGRDAAAETAALEAGLGAARGPVWLVSSEVGLGIVPENALARRFRDAAGLMNQRIAARADRVTLVAAGLPLALKG